MKSVPNQQGLYHFGHRLVRLSFTCGISNFLFDAGFNGHSFGMDLVWEVDGCSD